MFISAYSKEKRNNAPSPSGSNLEPTYAYEIDKKGMKELRENGKKDVQAEIESHFEDTKIENILARVTTGDTSMLRPDAIYADVSEMPNNLMEAMNQIHALENTYKELPEELKNKYGSIENYVKEAGSETWLRDMGYIQETIETDQEIMEKATIAGAPQKEVKDES